MAATADRLRALSQSACVSSDNAHAVHPNYPERHEPGHRPIVNARPGDQGQLQPALRHVGRDGGRCSSRRATRPACRGRCSCRATTCRAVRRSVRSPRPGSASPRSTSACRSCRCTRPANCAAPTTPSTSPPPSPTSSPRSFVAMSERTEGWSVRSCATPSYGRVNPPVRTARCHDDSSSWYRSRRVAIDRSRPVRVVMCTDPADRPTERRCGIVTSAVCRAARRLRVGRMHVDLDRPAQTRHGEVEPGPAVTTGVRSANWRTRPRTPARSSASPTRTSGCDSAAPPAESRFDQANEGRCPRSTRRQPFARDVEHVLRRVPAVVHGLFDHGT